MKSHRHAITVHWGDTDPAKIVFYPHYFSWFDESTRLLFDSAGLDWDTLMSKYAIVGLPLVEVKASFSRPSVFRDELVIESSITKWWTKTFQVDHAVYNRGSIAVQGYEVRAWCKADPLDPHGLGSFPVPPEIKAAFE